MSVQVEFHDGKESWGNAAMQVIPRRGERVVYGNGKKVVFKILRVEWEISPGDSPRARVIMRPMKKHRE